MPTTSGKTKTDAFLAALDGPVRMWMRDYILRMRLLTESCTNADGTPKPYERCPELQARFDEEDRIESELGW